MSSLAEVARFFGISPQAISSGWKARGMPGEKGRYDLSEIAQWRIQYERSRAEQSSEDALLAGGDSPALERYRQARAELEWRKLHQVDGDLVPMDEIREGLGRAAGCIRQCGEHLKRRFGNEALELLNEALDEFDSIIDEEFCDHGGESDDDE